MMGKILNKNILIFILILLILGTFYPFVFNKLLFGNRKAIATIVLICIWGIILFININKNRDKIELPNLAFFAFIIIQIIYTLLWGFYLSSNSIINDTISLCTSLIFLLFIINTMKIDVFVKYFTLYNIISLILTVLGIILVAFSLLKPLGVFGDSNYGTGSYTNYGFFFIKNLLSGDYMRPSGYYDECGSFAYIVSFLLLLNRKMFKNKMWEIILLSLPFFLTSLAHIISSTIYVMLFYFSKKNMKNFIFVISLIFVIYIFLSHFSSKNDIVNFMYERTVGRVENIIKNKEDNGSRDGGFKYGPKIYNENMWGISPEKVEQRYPEFVKETIWGPIIYYNPIGVCIYYLPIIYIFFMIVKNKNTEYFKYLILVVFNLMQRPFYVYPLFIVLIYILFFHEEKNRIYAK